MQNMIEIEDFNKGLELITSGQNSLNLKFAIDLRGFNVTEGFKKVLNALASKKAGTNMCVTFYALDFVIESKRIVPKYFSDPCVEALAEFLNSGKCPGNLTLILQDCNIGDAAFEKLCVALNSGTFFNLNINIEEETKNKSPEQIEVISKRKETIKYLLGKNDFIRNGVLVFEFLRAIDSPDYIDIPKEIFYIICSLMRNLNNIRIREMPAIPVKAITEKGAEKYTFFANIYNSLITQQPEETISNLNFGSKG